MPNLCMGTSGTPLQYVTVDRLSAFFYWTILFDNNVPFNNTTSTYLINLLWKLGLGLALDVSCTILAFFPENNENEHLIFREFHGR